MRIGPEQYRLVGTCLAAARRRANLTQTEAAEWLGRKQTFISEIERGLRRIDVLEIVFISQHHLSTSQSMNWPGPSLSARCHCLRWSRNATPTRLTISA